MIMMMMMMMMMAMMAMMATGLLKILFLTSCFQSFIVFFSQALKLCPCFFLGKQRGPFQAVQTLRKERHGQVAGRGGWALSCPLEGC